MKNRNVCNSQSLNILLQNFLRYFSIKLLNGHQTYLNFKCKTFFHNSFPVQISISFKFTCNDPQNKLMNREQIILPVLLVNLGMFFEKIRTIILLQQPVKQHRQGSEYHIKAHHVCTVIKSLKNLFKKVFFFNYYGMFYQPARKIHYVHCKVVVG